MMKITLQSFQPEAAHWQASRKASNERQRQWGRQHNGATYRHLLQTYQLAQANDAANIATMCVPAMPTQQEERHTDKYDLRIIALPRVLNELIERFYAHVKADPRCIRLNSYSALLLSEAGMTQEGFFPYKGNLIPVIPDAALDAYAIHIDH